ncbi:hypothetical protein [Aquimarina sp. AU474]|uniref:hypothetical protein n=1 Tax=Aquimarina sp. AU474 TaxID=2108529 RepID=UPI001359307B|nr:hypothetical protein [Aquimarina sp. AU474]
MDIPYKLVLLMTLSLFLVTVSIAQEGMSKTVQKTFPLTNGGELNLENKYGNVTLTGWDQEKVAVTIQIKVNHRKKESAKDLLSRINPEIQSTSGYVSIVSEIANKNTGWFADFFNRNNPIDFDRSYVKIDYEVFLPKKAKLQVTNRFGDVFIEDWSGPLNIVIEHGDLWLGEDLDKADIKLKFGKVRANDLNYANLTLKNGELDMKNSQSLHLSSNGTDIKINMVNSLEIFSNKDDIILEEAGTIYGSLKFTTLNLNRLIEDVNLSMKIADFRIKQILSSEAKIEIEQESSDINLTVANFSHRFIAKLEQGVVRLPKSFENVNSTMLNKAKKLREIEATYGKKQQGLISILGTKGIVTLND